MGMRNKADTQNSTAQSFSTCLGQRTMLLTVKRLSNRTTAGLGDLNMSRVEEKKPRVIGTNAVGCGWSMMPLCREKFRRESECVIANQLHRAPGAADGTESRFDQHISNCDTRCRVPVHMIRRAKLPVCTLSFETDEKL